MYMDLRGIKTKTAVTAEFALDEIMDGAGGLGCDLITLFVHESASVRPGPMGTAVNSSLDDSGPAVLLVFPKDIRECREMNSAVRQGAFG